MKHSISFWKRTAPHNRCTCNALLPTPGLDLAMSDDQVAMLNPSMRDLSIGQIMRDAGGLGANKKLAQRRLDCAGFVQSECFEVTDPVRIRRQKQALQLAAALAQISNAQAAEQAVRRALEDDELILVAPGAALKLSKHNMQWDKLTIKEARSIALVYFKKPIDKGLTVIWSS